MHCNDLQFDTLEEAQRAVQSSAGAYQVLEAGLYMRYEPVDGGTAAWTMKS
ncbi:MAG: hypothetical protein K2P04_06195 [Oscillospiraceae bacterium]|nr:hypothetical protein [Oscillospiraceae bacterium]